MSTLLWQCSPGNLWKSEGGEGVLASHPVCVTCPLAQPLPGLRVGITWLHVSLQSQAGTTATAATAAVHLAGFTLAGPYHLNSYILKVNPAESTCV